PVVSWRSDAGPPAGGFALPAAGFEQLARVERLRRDAHHRLAEAGGDAGKDLRVVEVRRRLDNRLRAALGVARLEDARADEDAGGAELHAERRVGGGRDSAGGERRDRHRPVRGAQLDELVRRALLLGLRVQLLLAQRAEPPDVAEYRAHVRARVDDVAGSRLALRTDHRCAL